MRWFGRRPPAVGTIFRGIALGATRNRNARHLDPGGRGANGGVIGIVVRQSSIAHGVYDAEPPVYFHGARADVIASHAAGRLTGRALFRKRYSDTPSGKVHCQCKADWTASDDQDLGVDA